MKVSDNKIGARDEFLAPKKIIGKIPGDISKFQTSKSVDRHTIDSMGLGPQLDSAHTKLTNIKMNDANIIFTRHRLDNATSQIDALKDVISAFHKDVNDSNSAAGTPIEKANKALLAIQTLINSEQGRTVWGGKNKQNSPLIKDLTSLRSPQEVYSNATSDNTNIRVSSKHNVSNIGTLCANSPILKQTIATIIKYKQGPNDISINKELKSVRDVVDETKFLINEDIQQINKAEKLNGLEKVEAAKTVKTIADIDVLDLTQSIVAKLLTAKTLVNLTNALSSMESRLEGKLLE